MKSRVLNRAPARNRTLFLGIPTPFPTMGRGSDKRTSFVCSAFTAVWLDLLTPEFGRLMARTAAV